MNDVFTLFVFRKVVVSEQMQGYCAEKTCYEWEWTLLVLAEAQSCCI